MHALNGTSQLFRVTAASAGSISCVASAIDKTGTGPSSYLFASRAPAVVTLTTASTQTVIAGLASTETTVEKLTVSNTSATVSNLVVVEFFDGTAAVEEWRGILLPDERVVMDSSGVWWYYAADGTLKSTTVPIVSNFSTATVTAAYATDTHVAGSAVALPSGGPIPGTKYRLLFDVVKTAAGVATPIVTLRVGTTGTVADAAILTFTFGAGTAAADTGTIEVEGHFRSVGAGTSAVFVGKATLTHQLASTGLTNTGTAGYAQLTSVSAGFNSTTAGLIISASFNGGASFSGTTTIVEAQVNT